MLDPFCGCATTPVAAEQLKRQWVGMDIWDGAKDIVLQRLQDEWLFTSDEAEHKMFPHVVHVETEPPTAHGRQRNRRAHAQAAHPAPGRALAEDQP